MSKRKYAILSAVLPFLAQADTLHGAQQKAGALPSLFADPFAIPKQTAQQRQRLALDKERQRKLAQGLKEFSYAQGCIWALNQANADRKARAKGWL